MIVDTFLLYLVLCDCRYLYLWLMLNDYAYFFLVSNFIMFGGGSYFSFDYGPSHIYGC